MLAELERGAADRAARVRLAPLLRAGPWCWPTSDHPSHGLASEIAGLSGAPAPPVSAIPGLTVEGACGFAWVLHCAPGLPSSAEMARSARRSWDAASLALPRSVPLLWNSVSAAHADEPRLLLVGTHVTQGQAPRCSVVHGPSFGLAFFLLQASHVFGTAMPGDLAASAALTEDGRVDPVEGLPLKLATVRALLPRVRRVLVAASQADEAREHAGDLTIVGVASASQALEHVFGQGLGTLLLAEGSDPQRRQELAEWFFRFALVGRAELVDWSPIASATAQALALWPELTPDQQFLLGFARGVAERHEFNAGTLPVPSEAWMLARPAPLRLQVLAHLVQQSADTGTPEVGAIAPLIARFREPDIRNSQPMAWRVEGARARLLAVTGRPHEALERQATLARAYFDSLLYGDVSFPLTEWFRLAGVLDDPDAFAGADALRQAIEPLGALGFHGSAYVTLARARAALQLGVGPRAEALAPLRRITADPTVAHHVRWAAARVLVRELDPAHPDHVAAHEAIARAARADDRRVHHAARVASALTALDAAVSADARDRAREPLATLTAAEPGILAHLMQAARTDPAPAFVARFYPY